NFTPPMAVACFVAAPIANTSPHRVGFIATRIGVMAYILPFIFVYKSAILLGIEDEFTTASVVFSIVISLLITLAVILSVAGYLFKEIHVVSRILLIVAALFMLTNHLICLIGIALFIITFIYEWITKRLVDREATILKELGK